jgi:hypothetical protein
MPSKLKVDEITTNTETGNLVIPSPVGLNIGTNSISQSQINTNLIVAQNLRTGVISSSSGNSAISISENGSTSITPNVINRGDPAAGAPLITLSDFTTSHYYETAGSVLQLRTGLVQNAVYELIYTASAGSANIDFVLQPNGATYGSEFFAYYRATDGAASFVQASQTLPQFYFDHLFGGTGADPMGRLWFTSGPTNKYAQYVGSDTTSLSIGYCRWTNNSRTWDWVGTLTFNGNNKRCWIRRVG